MKYLSISEYHLYTTRVPPTVALRHEKESCSQKKGNEQESAAGTVGWVKVKWRALQQQRK